MKTSNVNGASKTLPQKFPHRKKFRACGEYILDQIAELELRRRLWKHHRAHNFRLENF